MSVKKYIVNFIKQCKPTYYVMLGISFAATLIGVISAISLTFAGNSYLAAIFAPIGLIAFIALSLVGQERLGAVFAAGCTFASFIGLIVGVYAYFLEEIQNQAMTQFDILAVKGFLAFVVFAVLLLLLSIAANVLAWMRLKRKPAESTEYGKKEIGK